MKINPGDNQQQLVSSTTVQSDENAKGVKDFSKVLQDTVQKSSGSSHDGGQVSRPSLSPFIGKPPVSKNPDVIAADGLLDALEKYQALLGDPDVSLKAVEPSLEKMRSVSESVEPWMAQLPDGDPVKKVIGEALVHISKEIVRFKGGLYIDR